MARRDLSSDEESLWRSFARTILPLRDKAGRLSTRHGRPQRRSSDQQNPSGDMADRSGDVQGKAGTGPGSNTSADASPTLRIREVMRVMAVPVPRARQHARLEINNRQPGLDTTSWNALASGKMKPQRRLDLHGHFAQDAFHKLHHFLHASSAQGVRCVEVITGLGSGQEGGVIRQELPHWLDRGDLRPLILAVVHTHKKNKGAVRILLRSRDRL
ncbi:MULTISPECIES: Smr/MutS family protein [unclassified Asaia]|uniref:Smr/MutS family protein n=1 Tax=unclassified Asaia TaxID=2685023 RepID=UPI001F48E51A|nr:Smr/MutS family protein [Asaia sp. W19]